MSHEAPLRNEHIIACYVTSVVLYLLFQTAKKIYYRYKFQQDFYVLPRLDIRSISGISMMTAMNIALIITISTLSNQIMGIFFKVYPGARFLIENVLIKLGGILFGPLVGIFIGFTTDLFTVIFTSSVLNYGYFFSAMMNGFLGGLIHNIIHLKEDNNNKKTYTSVLLGLISLFFVGIVLSSNALGKAYNARILSLNISMQWYILFLLIATMVVIAIGLLLASNFATNNVNNEKYNYKRWIHYMSEKYSFFLITMCNTSIYLLVDMIALPMFDVSLSSLPYEQFLVCRIIVSIPSVILFSYLIHYIYKLHLSVKRTPSKNSSLVTDPTRKVTKKEILSKLAH